MRCAKRVSRTGLRAAFLLAALVLSLGERSALAQRLSPAPTPALPATPAPSQEQYDQCLALTRANPQQAYDQALAWRDEGGSFPADHCAAVALIALKRYPEAAQKLEILAGAMMQAAPALRGGALEQAGSAWLMAGRSDEAKTDFDSALTFEPNNAEILIDRAEALGLGGKFFDAIDDLNRALELEPHRVDALIYRASAYRQLDSLDLALDDAEQALKIQPDTVAGLLERGNIRRLKGDLAGAKADWQRILALAPDSTESVAAKDNLAHLADEPGAAAPKPTAKP
jgi:tetratricopeptide (TPR) repeat protein